MSYSTQVEIPGMMASPSGDQKDHNLKTIGQQYYMEVSLKIQNNTGHLEQVQRIVPPEVDDIRQIIVRCEHNSELHTVGNMVRVLANTGLRRGEFTEVRRSDIDPDGQWLHVGGSSGIGGNGRMLPIRPLTLEALLSLHRMNAQSEFVLGDRPKARFDYALRKLRTVAPQLVQTRAPAHSIRVMFAYRLWSADIAPDVVGYLLGRRTSESLRECLLTHEQWLGIVTRSMEWLVDEL